MAEPIIAVQIEGDARKDPRLWEKHAKFKAYLSDYSVLEAVAAHEAGHEFYFRKAGVTSFDYLGPRIVRSRDGKDFDCFSASVQPKTFDPTYLQLGEAMIGLAANACVAGGSVSKMVMHAADRGDQGDFERFEGICAAVCAKNPSLRIDCRELWEGAQPKMDREVCRFANRTKILKLARKIQPLLFKW